MENAYKSPLSTGHRHQSGTKKQGPTGLKILAIFCIVLGSMGLLASCFAGVGLVFQSQFNGMQMGGPNPEFQKQMAAIQSEQMIPNIIMTVINFIIAPMLLVGGIGCLQRASWARGTLRIALLAAAIFNVVRGVVGIFMQMRIMGPMQKMAANQQANQEAVANIMAVSMIVGIVIGVIWILAMAGFYIWGWLYLDKTSVKEYLGA